jgi:catechol 2,3-dioxygenase-like lactoylglutathione lyase family enzyme
MFDHVTIRVSDRAKSEAFYELVLGTIGIEKTSSSELGPEWNDFSLTEDAPATRGLHIGFCAPSHDDVDRFWRAGVDAGYESDGEPGPRAEYRDDYYGSFLLDPDGNSVEAVHHGGMRAKGNIDHLWIRVADLAATAGFYEKLSPYTGFRLKSRPPGRVHFEGEGTSFALLEDSYTTENLHIAFGSDADGSVSNNTVDAFHAAAIAAGYRDNGRPGERPAYHPGYYAAFVLDPDGANVEVVRHNS